MCLLMFTDVPRTVLGTFTVTKAEVPALMKLTVWLLYVDKHLSDVDKHLRMLTKHLSA